MTAWARWYDCCGLMPRIRHRSESWIRNSRQLEENRVGLCRPGRAAPTLTNHLGLTQSPRAGRLRGGRKRFVKRTRRSTSGHKGVLCRDSDLRILGISSSLIRRTTYAGIAGFGFGSVAWQCTWKYAAGSGSSGAFLLARNPEQRLTVVASFYILSS